MFSEGNLLYFNPFIFPDGGTPKPKYFIVLKDIDGTLLLAALPSSKVHIPDFLMKRQGCIEDAENNVNAYVFSSDREVADGFKFRVDTFVYGFGVKTYPVSVFEEQIKNGQTTVTMCGKINHDLFLELKKCLKDSGAVKRKYKVYL